LVLVAKLTAVLQPLEAVDDEKPGRVEEQHGDRIGDPVLLALLVDAAGPIEDVLDGTQDRRKECALALEHMRHEPAEGNDERREDHEIDRDLKPAVEGHCRCAFQNRSGRSRA
jgi:hypothetical protein